MKNDYPYITKRGNKAKKSDLEFLPLDFEPFADEVDESREMDTKNAVVELLKHLTEKESTILKLRFGIPPMNGVDHTLDEVAAMYGFTRERVRQIEARALRKLRHPTRSADYRCLCSNGSWSWS